MLTREGLGTWVRAGQFMLRVGAVAWRREITPQFWRERGWSEQLYLAIVPCIECGVGRSGMALIEMCPASSVDVLAVWFRPYCGPEWLYPSIREGHADLQDFGVTPEDMYTIQAIVDKTFEKGELSC